MQQQPLISAILELVILTGWMDWMDSSTTMCIEMCRGVVLWEPLTKIGEQ